MVRAVDPVLKGWGFLYGFIRLSLAVLRLKLNNTGILPVANIILNGWKGVYEYDYSDEAGSYPEEIENVEKRLVELGFKTHPIYGEVKTVIGAVGDKRLLEKHNLMQLPGVEIIVPIMKPYKLVGRELKNEDTVVKVDDVEIGGSRLVVMAGPCAVESEEQICEVAEKVKEAGAAVLREEPTNPGLRRIPSRAWKRKA